MSAQVTVTLPEDVFRRAEWWAQRTGRPVAALLAEAIELSLRPLGVPSDEGKALESWSDDAILTAVNLAMSADDDRRLTELLDRQQADLLADTEPAELAGLMQVYQEGLLRKARTLREAVRRGLREPLAS